MVGVSNVQWRKSSGTGAIPLGHVTETTVFAQHSKSSLIQEAINDLKEDLEGVCIYLFISNFWHWEAVNDFFFFYICRKTLPV